MSGKELRVAEDRNRAANILRDKIGLDAEPTEFEMMLAEIRTARRFRARLGLKEWPTGRGLWGLALFRNGRPLLEASKASARQRPQAVKSEQP